MAQLPKGGLVRGHDKPIHGSCAIYFPGGTHKWGVRIDLPKQNLELGTHLLNQLEIRSLKWQLGLVDWKTSCMERFSQTLREGWVLGLNASNHSPWKLKGFSGRCIAPPGRLTWNQITHLDRKKIFQTSIIMFHVNLQECSKNSTLVVIQDVFFWNESSQLMVNCWFGSLWFGFVGSPKMKGIITYRGTRFERPQISN